MPLSALTEKDFWQKLDRNEPFPGLEKGPFLLFDYSFDEEHGDFGSMKLRREFSSFSDFPKILEEEFLQEMEGDLDDWIAELEVDRAEVEQSFGVLQSRLFWFLAVSMDYQLLDIVLKDIHHDVYVGDLLSRYPTYRFVVAWSACAPAQDVALCILQKQPVSCIPERQHYFEAVAGSDRKLIEEAIAAGLHHEMTDEQGLSLLHYAVAYRQPDTVRLLLEAGANPNFQSDFSSSPLFSWFDDEMQFVSMAPRGAMIEGKEHFACLELLLEAGAEPSAMFPGGNLLDMCLNSTTFEEEHIDYFLEKGVPFEKFNGKGTYERYEGKARILHAVEEFRNMYDRNPERVLWWVKLLLKLGEDPNTIAEDSYHKQTPLHALLSTGYRQHETDVTLLGEIARVLIEAGAEEVKSEHDFDRYPGDIAKNWVKINPDYEKILSVFSKFS